MKKRLFCVAAAVCLLLGLTAGCGSTASEKPLTAQQAGAVIREVNERYMEMFCYFIFPTTEMKTDSTRALPGDPDMWLVTDEQFPDMQAMRDFLRTAVTDAFIDKQSPRVFNEDYITPQEAAARGLDAVDYATIYYEHAGHLYANQNPPTPQGSLSEVDWDNPTVVSQSTEKLAVEYPLLLPHYLGDDTISYEIVGSTTYTVIKANDKWLLDDITETK